MPSENAPQRPALILASTSRYRAQLLLRSSRRQELHAALAACLAALPGWRETRRVRWSLDIDPLEL